jgi:hypothetical protein
VPANYLHFLMEEAGYSAIEVRELHPAKDLIGELAALDKIKELRGFRKRFFGGLDYLIAARKWKA